MLTEICVFCGQQVPHRKPTNADRIRAMSDEELAKIIAGEPIAEIIPFCKNLPQCEIDLETQDGVPQERCVQCVLDWLRAEATGHLAEQPEKKKPPQRCEL